jgi:hypothetical protein
VSKFSPDVDTRLGPQSIQHAGSDLGHAHLGFRRLTGEWLADEWRYPQSLGFRVPLSGEEAFSVDPVRFVGDIVEQLEVQSCPDRDSGYWYELAQLSLS